MIAIDSSPPVPGYWVERRLTTWAARVGQRWRSVQSLIKLLHTITLLIQAKKNPCVDIRISYRSDYDAISQYRLSRIIA